jgi:uncharacterized coiled-coil DUF342 family protein
MSHDIDPKIDELLSEFKEHRDEIKKMIVSLEDIKSKIDTLIPDTLDKRVLRFFEEKVKTVTNLFSTLLEMRKEIQKSVKDELEIRRKIKISDDDESWKDALDIRDIADRIQEFSTTREDFKKDLEKSEIPEGVDIPGMTSTLTS